VARIRNQGQDLPSTRMQIGCGLSLSIPSPASPFPSLALASPAAANRLSFPRIGPSQGGDTHLAEAPPVSGHGGISDGVPTSSLSAATLRYASRSRRVSKRGRINKIL